jgi:hypothetical protein
VNTQSALGKTLARAFVGASIVGALTLASGSVGAQTRQDYPPNIPPVIVPPNSTLAPAQAAAVPVSVLDAVVTTTTSTTTTRLPAPAVVLSNTVAAPAKVPTQVLGETITQPAFTGSNSIPTALAGLGLFAAGSVLVIGARRRRPQA